MPDKDQIIIHPSDMQTILDHLSAMQWSQGEIIIRDMGNQYIIRDAVENFITSVNKTDDDDG